MQVGKVSSGISVLSIQSEIGFAVLGKNMDAMKQAGEGLIKVMESASLEQSVNPHLGGNINLRV